MPTAEGSSDTTLTASPQAGTILDDYYDLGGLAQFFNVCTRTLERTMLATGDAPPSIVIGKRTRLWKKTSVQEWLEAREPRPRRRRA